jgi:hypothetical protein
VGSLLVGVGLRGVSTELDGMDGVSTELDEMEGDSTELDEMDGEREKTKCGVSACRCGSAWRQCRAK